MNPMRYLTGSRVYRASSNAPTRGTVDPMGYINRSMGMSPVGGDGFSDKRSGLAQLALQRLRMSRGGMMGFPHQQQVGMANPRDNANMPVIGMPRNPIDFGAPPGKGYSVSPTGQLVPLSATPHQTTLNNMYGQPQGPMQMSEPELMQAARDRLSHRIQTKEMLTKHQIAMQRMNMQHAQHINQHRERSRDR